MKKPKQIAAYYIANSAIRLNKIGADKLMEDFVADYPTSTKRNTAYIDVADYYFEQGKYPQALKWYDRVMESNMSHKERERFNFNKGYALFTAKKYKDSRAYFETVTHTPTYGAQAKYYIGYMAYQSDDYRQANQYFDKFKRMSSLVKNYPIIKQI